MTFCIQFFTQRATPRETDNESERRKLYRFVFRDVVLAGKASAFCALIWSILLLLPGHLFATNRLFGQMAIHAPEWAFGLLFLALAGLQSQSLRVCRLPLEFVSLMAGAVMWGMISLLVANASPPFPWWPHCLPFAPGPYIYGGLFGWLCASLLRIGPGLGDDFVLWQRQRSQRRISAEIEQARTQAQEITGTLDAAHESASKTKVCQ